jgi:hypothetical protein
MTNDKSSGPAGAAPADNSITWDHPSRLIAQFVIESAASSEQVRATLDKAATDRRYRAARGVNALGELRLDGEVGLSSFDLTATPYLMPHIRTRAPKLQVYGDIRPAESGSQIAVTVVCSSWLSDSNRAQYAADVRAVLTDIVAAASAATSGDIRAR